MKHSRFSETSVQHKEDYPVVTGTSNYANLVQPAIQNRCFVSSEGYVVQRLLTEWKSFFLCYILFGIGVQVFLPANSVRLTSFYAETADRVLEDIDHYY